jgi:hypothetical protein
MLPVSGRDTNANDGIYGLEEDSRAAYTPGLYRNGGGGGNHVPNVMYSAPTGGGAGNGGGKSGGLNPPEVSFLRRLSDTPHLSSMFR